MDRWTRGSCKHSISSRFPPYIKDNLGQFFCIQRKCGAGSQRSSSSVSQLVRNDASHQAQCLLKTADVVKSRVPELQKYFIQEAGAESALSKFNMTMSMEMLRDIAGRIPSAMTGNAPTSENENSQAIVLKEPYGVVLRITPW